MVDIVDKQTRSRMMSGIKGKNTKPEIIVRKYLHKMGLRYRLHDKGVYGKPDIVLKKYNAVIFVHGCYWHRHKNCKLAYTPKSRKNFWLKKFEQNINRDEKVRLRLLKDGWRVAIIWECVLRKNNKDNVPLKIMLDWVQSDENELEFPY